MKDKLLASFNTYIQTVYKGSQLHPQQSTEVRMAFCAGVIQSLAILTTSLAEVDGDEQKETACLTGIIDAAKELSIGN